jgi:hypothetical protein
LHDDPSPQADAFAIEAQVLLNILESWERDVPPADSRSETIAQVLDLHRRAMDYITAKTLPPPA